LWLNTPTKSTLSLLSAATNHVLTYCAKLSNKTVSIDSSRRSKPLRVPRAVRLSSVKLLKVYRKVKQLKLSTIGLNNVELQKIQQEYSQQRTKHRKLLRSFRAEEAVKRDSVLMSNPSATFARIKKAKRQNIEKLHQLKVGPSVCIGEKVPDGFYALISDLKKRPKSTMKSSSDIQDFTYDYLNILNLSKTSKQVKPITETESLDILLSMKSGVNDLYSVTPQHYLHAGPVG